MRLGELIAVARECKGWTLRDLEKESGVSNALISQIETGKIGNPGFVTVVRLVDALGVTLDRAATAERGKRKVLREAAERKQDASKCGCWICLEARGEMRTRMILCPECGNKRCPKATNHELACTGSNVAGQPGSCY